MKKQALLLFILIPIFLISQNDTDIEVFTDETVFGNAYRYQKAFIDNEPFISTTFVFEKIFGDRFSDAYDIASTEKKVKRKVLKYGIWMIDSDSVFFINIMRYGYADMYIKFRKQEGNYYYFKAPPRLPDIQRNKNESLYLLGITGAAVAVAVDENRRPKNLHAVLDFDRDAVTFLTREYIEELLLNYPDILDDFYNENDQEDIEVLRSYLEKVNSKCKSSVIAKSLGM